ncbi:MAG: phosphoserine phosphatase SerB [Chloroflexota bacterium]|nr:phosphoserine phosphatase SerB [Chloroflexota bacterium]
MTQNTEILLTVTGLDRPGITATLCRCLGEVEAELLDIQQVTIAPLLVMALHLRLPVSAQQLESGPAGYLPPSLYKVAYEMELSLKVQPYRPVERAMPLELLYAVTCLAPKINPAALGRISATISDLGANIERITRLADGDLLALELTVRAPAQLEHSKLKRALFAVSNECRVDIAVQPESLYRRSKRLIVLDVDSTLIQHEVIDEVARLVGVEDKVVAITAEAMAGRLNFAEALRERVNLLSGLPVARLDEVSIQLQLTPGAERLIFILKKLGYKTAIVSGGFTFFTDQLKERLKLDYAYANTLEIENGCLTGRVLGPIIDAKGKARLLTEIAEREGIEMAQTLAVGDGANDLLMLEAAGLGVAFNAKPIVREAADFSISQPRLDVLLYLIGIRDYEVQGLELEL